MRKCIVGGCVVVHNGRVLLLKHKKLGVWLYPGGHMEPNETPLDTALRETEEETGMKVRLVDTSGRKRITDKVASEPPQPIAMMLEKVPYKNGPTSTLISSILQSRAIKAELGYGSANPRASGGF
jgi:8-oxo-dGTP pyrophosphatase MutT (NUDIX family)